MKRGWLSGPEFDAALLDAVRAGELIPLDPTEAGRVPFNRPDGTPMVARQFMYREDWDAERRNDLERRRRQLEHELDLLRRSWEPLTDN